MVHPNSTNQSAHQQQKDLRLAVREGVAEAAGGRRQLGGDTLRLMLPGEAVCCCGLRNSITVDEACLQASCVLCLAGKATCMTTAFVIDACFFTSKDAPHSCMAVRQMVILHSRTSLACNAPDIWLRDAWRSRASASAENRSALSRSRSAAATCATATRRRRGFVSLPLGSWEETRHCKALCGTTLPSTLQLHATVEQSDDTRH